MRDIQRKVGMAANRFRMRDIWRRWDGVGQIPDVRHPEKGRTRLDRIPDVRHPEKGGMCYAARRRGDRLRGIFLGRIPQVGEGLERETGWVGCLGMEAWVSGSNASSN